MKPAALILGGGVFGLTAAIELRARGWKVTLLEAGTIPHPDAASTDISKVVRMDYGRDVQYTEMGELSLQRWREWNKHWGEALYHEDGFLVLTAGNMEEGCFERDSQDFLRARGHVLEVKKPDDIRRQHPQWKEQRPFQGISIRVAAGPRADAW